MSSLRIESAKLFEAPATLILYGVRLIFNIAVLEDWKLVARGMRLQPGAVNRVVITKPHLDSAVRTRSLDANRNKITEIWDAVGPKGFTIYSKRIPGLVCELAPLNNTHIENIEKSQTEWLSELP